jgi:DNA-binding XRE family transcriptional regulator
LIVTGEQLRGARAMARVEQADLASIASVSVETIKRLERTSGRISANVTTMDAILKVLIANGIEFTNGGQPGVRFLPDLHGPRVEVDSVDGIRRVKFRSAGAALRILSKQEALNEAESADNRNERELAMILRGAAAKLL